MQCANLLFGQDSTFFAHSELSGYPFSLSRAFTVQLSLSPFAFLFLPYRVSFLVISLPLSLHLSQSSTIRNCEQLSLRWSERQLATIRNLAKSFSSINRWTNFRPCHSNPQLSLRSPCAKKLNGLFLPSFRLEWRLARRIHHPTQLLIHWSVHFTWQGLPVRDGDRLIEVYSTLLSRQDSRRQCTRMGRPSRCWMGSADINLE